MSTTKDSRLEPTEIAGLEKMLGVSKIMAMQTNLHDQLSVILTEATGVTNAERATLFLTDPDTNTLVSYIALQSEVREIRVPMGKGIAGSVATTGKNINLEDAYQSPLFDRSWDEKTGFRTTSVLCVPMREPNGNLKGVIQVLNQKDGAFTKAHEDLLSLFASHAAISINNVELHQQLKQTFLSGIRALAAAVDCKDPVTAGHTERVTYYAVKLAEVMGLSQDEISAIEYAGTLHDLGKIGIPDAILTKPDKLTDEEYQVVKGHAAATRRIAEKFDFRPPFQDVPFIAGAHHERIDGSGYPDGLKGDDLPMAARILGVADVFDAVTSFDRPYRNALTPEEGVELLMSEAGLTLDADVVQAFITHELFRLERRHAARMDVETSVLFRMLPRGRHDAVFDANEGTSIDISERGIRFSTSEFVPVGSYVEMEIQFGDHSIDVLGKVVRADRIFGATFDVAVAMVNLTDATETWLKEYLVKLKAA